MEYVKQHKSKEEEYTRYFGLPNDFSDPILWIIEHFPFCVRNEVEEVNDNDSNDNNDLKVTPQLIQSHIQRLESETDLTKNYHENSNEPKINNFIKNIKKMNEREFYSKSDKFNMKGK